MRVDPSLVRSGQWWDHKLPPVIAAAALTVLARGAAPGAGTLVELALFLVAAIGVAAFGHVVNDLADVRTDALAGKPNAMAALGLGPRAALVTATVAAGGLPWIWLPLTAPVVALLAAEVALLVLYSVPPVRLKDRSLAGVVADALYAYVLPVLLAVAVFGAGEDLPDAPWLVALVAGWMVLMGLRGILWHQVDDVAHDRRAGVHTVATSIGPERTERLVAGLVVVEAVVAAAALGSVAVVTGSAWVAWFSVAYLAYRSFQMSLLWSEPVHPAALRHRTGRVRYLGFVVLNEYLEKWLPLAALVAVALRSPVWWVAVAVHLLVFRNAAGEVLRHDLPALPDGLNRLAHEGKARRQIRLVAQRRRAECRSGPVALGDDVRSGRRWVFVVCGGALHIDTLRTAVAHLRPLTSLEIWVVTDSRRNVHPIDTDGVDRVVDVATPAELDDHQASIWLKTSVHRHVPPGEWCYLDSDIIAVRPGMEQVFEHRRGPVAFAPDLTISVNRVDRFSPWAMNCDCSGYGDRHSCSHLREQIALRLGVEVPGDWVHWNGGVFVFGPDSGDFLDLWHRTAIESFSWPEWRTRDQGALIATVWRTGHQELVGLPQAFNFIADLGNGDLCLEAERGWALHPQGPWHEPYLLHCYTSSLELEDWDLGRDVEAPVVRQTVVRVQRWRRWVALQRGKEAGKSAYWSGMERWWVLKDRLNLYRIRTVHQFRRLRPGRMLAAVRRRRGTLDDGWDPSPPDPPGGRGSAEQDATAPASIQGRAS